MFLRSHQRSKDGKGHTYWSVVETVRTADGPRQRRLCYLAVVYKIVDRFRGKLWLLRCLRGGGVYDLTRRRGVTLQVEQSKQLVLQRAYARAICCCGERSLA